MTPCAAYCELATATNFSFLRGASHPEDLVARALLLGHTGIGIADRNTVAGVVRAYGALEDLRRDGLPAPQKIRDGSGPGEHVWIGPPDAAEWAAISEAVKERAHAFRLAAGARLVFADGTPDIIAYPATRDGWARICRLLTLGKRRAEKGDCHITRGDLLADHDDLLLIVLPPDDGGAIALAEVDTTLSAEHSTVALDSKPAHLLCAPPARHFPLSPRGEGRGEGALCFEGTARCEEALRCRPTGSKPPHPNLLPKGRRDVPSAGDVGPASNSLVSNAPAGDGSMGDGHANNPDITTFEAHVRTLAAAAPGRVWIAAAMHLHGDDRRRLAVLQRLSEATRLPLLAINDVLYDTPAQRPVQDVLTCIREGLTIETAGRRLEANAERHLKSTSDMAQLFRDAPAALAATQHLIGRVAFSLADLAYEYPDEPVPEDWTAQAWLEHLTWQRAELRYPAGTPAKVARQIRDELCLIDKLNYAPYFLTIHDIVRYAEEQGILCQGRGSAANSAVCYVLGITAVDPAKHNLLFARFISSERREPPDIDVDFEHERREEVIQYIYRRYGRARAGIVATVIRYRPRSAIREVGKVLGLTEDITARIAGTVWGSWGSALPAAHLAQAGLDPDNPVIHQAISLATQILGFPRHLSQHVGGFVLTRGRLDDIVPIGNAAMDERTFIEWDKDDIDTLGLMKVDVLALGMLTCIRKSLDLMRDHEGCDYELATVPPEEEDVYAMLQKGDSIGVFQVESRAQINMLPRLRPKQFYDLVIQVAIVRPGPIQGDMVHPYLRRRQGLEQVTFPSPGPPHDKDELRKVLSRTLGVPLFQEQAMQLAMVAAEFTDGEANQLRRAMATFRNVGTIHKFEALLVERMVARGYERSFAERCFEQIKGFGEYGFPESHAASFANLVYVSSFIKCRYPAVFACALLNSQPMGFYAPAQIVRDAREHGVSIYEVDANFSLWDNALCHDERGNTALRLGLRQVDGMRQAWADTIVLARANHYDDIESLAARTRLPNRALRLLADADCLRSMDLDRRNALWKVRRLPDDDTLPLFAAARERDLADEPEAYLPAMPPAEHVVADYQTLRLSLKGHPMQFLRATFDREKLLHAAAATLQRDGAWVKTAGIVLVRQRPGKGTAIFMTLEDETGIVNVVLWASKFDRFRPAVMGARLLVVEGRIQRSPEGVVHLMAERVFDRSSELHRLSDTHETRAALAPADEFLNPQQPRAHHPRDVRVIPKSRDFH